MQPAPPDPDRTIRVAINATALMSPATGIGTYVRHLAMEMMRLPETRVDLFDGLRFTDSLRQQPVPGSGRALPWIRGNIPNSYVIKRTLQNALFRRGIKQRHPDIYHEPNYLPFHFDGPVVVTVHDLSWIHAPQAHPVERVRAMERWFPAALDRADRIITDSESVRAELHEHFPATATRTDVVHLGASDIYRPRDDDETLEAVRALGLRRGRYLIAVGTLEPRKNLISALTAFSRLPASVRRGHPLVIVGMRGWNHAQADRQLAAMVAGGEVIQPGYVSAQALGELVGGARASIYLSLYEGFGLPPLESMQSGVPVIASNVSSVPEIVADGGLLVPPLDIDAITSAMQRICDDDALHAELATRARRRAAVFSWERCARETRRCYAEVLQR